MCYTLMGKSIEFYRLSANQEKDIPIQDMTSIQGITFCHRNTYMKMIKGEIYNLELYEQIMSINNICYQYDASLQSKINELYKQIKKAIEYLDFNSVKQFLKEGFILLKGCEDCYPHAMDFFIFQKLENAFIKNEKLDLKRIKLITFLLDIVCDEARVILSHLVYHDAHKRKGIISSLENVMYALPIQDNEEILYKLIILRQKIYTAEFNNALRLLEEINQLCIETNNIPRACELHQFYIAVYQGLGQLDKAEKEKIILKKEIKKPNTNYYVKTSSEFYLGMCEFSEHNFDVAKPFLEKQIKRKGKDVSITIVLFYLCILSYQNEENLLFTITDSEIRQLKSHYKMFMRYFYMKNNKRKSEVLISFILDKILPILDKDYCMETAIFYQELHLLNASPHNISKFVNHVENMNYVILQEWRDTFKNN